MKNQLRPKGMNKNFVASPIPLKCEKARMN